MRFMPESNYPGPVLKDPCFWACAGYCGAIVVLLCWLM